MATLKALIFLLMKSHIVFINEVFITYIIRLINLVTSDDNDNNQGNDLMCLLCSLLVCVETQWLTPKLVLKRLKSLKMHR